MHAGVIFTNVLHAAFMLVDPKSVKNTVKLSIFFTLLGSTSVKAVDEIDTRYHKRKSDCCLDCLFALLGFLLIKALRKLVGAIDHTWLFFRGP